METSGLISKKDKVRSQGRSKEGRGRYGMPRFTLSSINACALIDIGRSPNIPARTLLGRASAFPARPRKRGSGLIEMHFYASGF